MTDRDTFAAAALTGLLVHANDGIDEETLDTPSDIAYTAYQMADAMLRERDKLSASDSIAHTGVRCRGGGDCPSQDNAANLDAAPAAIATEPEPEPAARRRPAGGTGDTDHGASPEARAESDEDRTDKAATSHRRDGTGDTPVTEPMPAFISGSGFVTPISYADSNAKPVAWGVVYPNDEVAVIAFKRNDAEERATASDSIVPLYRHPPCQDFLPKNLTLTDAERDVIEWCRQSCSNVRTPQGNRLAATLRGLLDRLVGGE